MTTVLRNTPSDAEVVYFDERKLINEKLKVPKQRVGRAERGAKKAAIVHWTHIGDLKHLNELRKELPEFEFGNFKPR